MGDCAYGDGDTRRTFAEAGRNWWRRWPAGAAKPVPQRGLPDRSGDDELHLPRRPGDAEGGVDQFGRSLRRAGRALAGVPLRRRRLRRLPVAASCVRARPGKGRLVMIHPQEAVLQEARAFQHSEAFAPYRKLRQAAEHRLARLMQLGVRQARYFGRTKTSSNSLWPPPSPISRGGGGGAASCEDRNHPQTVISTHVYAYLCFATCSQLCRYARSPVFGRASSPAVTLIRNGPVNAACRTLIEESRGCEDDQAALQGA